MNKGARPGLASKADNRHRADVAGRSPAEIVRQPYTGVRQLAITCATLQLQIHFIQHPQSRRTNGMAKAFQATINLARHLAIAIIKAIHDIFPALAFGRDEQVFHGHKLGHREAIMDLNHRNLVTRAVNWGDGGLVVQAGRVVLKSAPPHREAERGARPLRRLRSPRSRSPSPVPEDQEEELL